MPASTKRNWPKRRKTERGSPPPRVGVERYHQQRGRNLKNGQWSIPTKQPPARARAATVCRKRVVTVVCAQGRRDRVKEHQASLDVGHQRDDAGPKPPVARAGERGPSPGKDLASHDSSDESRRHRGSTNVRNANSNSDTVSSRRSEQFDCRRASVQSQCHEQVNPKERNPRS